MKHRFLIVLIICFFINAQVVFANIMCNDGSISPSCSDCHQGCCSHHGGCASTYNTTYNGYVNSGGNQNYDEDFDLEDEYDYYDDDSNYYNSNSNNSYTSNSDNSNDVSGLPVIGAIFGGTVAAAAAGIKNKKK